MTGPEPQVPARRASGLSRRVFHSGSVATAAGAVLSGGPAATGEAAALPSRSAADTLSSYVVNFAATGSPSGREHRQPRWPQLDSAKPAVMEAGNAFGPIPAASTQARYEFIKRWLESQPKNW